MFRVMRNRNKPLKFKDSSLWDQNSAPKLPVQRQQIIEWLVPKVRTFVHTIVCRHTVEVHEML